MCRSIIMNVALWGCVCFTFPTPKIEPCLKIYDQSLHIPSKPVVKPERDVNRIQIYPSRPLLLIDQKEPFRILSINNSLIDFNDQPSIFCDLAESLGHSVNWEKQTRLGQSLLYHYNEGDDMTTNGPSAKMVVRSKPWTHIILQEYSNMALVKPDELMSSVEMWVDYIRQNCPNSNVKIILTVNWPYNASSDYGGESMKMFESYLRVSKELGISLCPIGLAYKKIMEIDGENARQELFTDHVHPSYLASYLAACCLYSSIYGLSALESTFCPSAVSEVDALRMRQRAWSVLSEYVDVVRDHSQEVDFSYRIYDQNDQPIDSQDPPSWSVSGGGEMHTSGTFQGNRLPGSYDVKVSVGELVSQTEVVVAGSVDDYYGELSLDKDYSQNFDQLGIAPMATLPLGWKVVSSDCSAFSVGSYAAANNRTRQSGGRGMSSENSGGIYNLGAGERSQASDRSLGGIPPTKSNSESGIGILLRLKNIGLNRLSHLQVDYCVEKYRKGNSFSGTMMQMYYSNDGENWSSAGDSFRCLFEPDQDSSGFNIVPGEVQSVSSELSVGVDVGKELFLGWRISSQFDVFASSAQALSLDNLSVRGFDVSTSLDNLDSDRCYFSYMDEMIICTGDGFHRLELINMQGELIATYQNVKAIPISFLEKGVYLIRGELEDRTCFVDHLVKQ